MSLKELFSDVSRIAGFLSEKGWAESNAGNISINITSFINPAKIKSKPLTVFKLNKNFEFLNNSFIWVTGSGIRMRDLSQNIEKGSLILNISKNGLLCNVYGLSGIDKNFKKTTSTIAPTSALPSHLAIQNFQSKINSGQNIVLHTHLTEFIALTQINAFCSENKINNLLRNMQPETKNIIPNGVGFVKFQNPGSENLASETIKSLKNHNVVIWEKHGTMCTGCNILNMFDTLELISKSLNIFFICKSAGFSPSGLK